MNRKLQRSTLALSATSVVFAALLVLGGPAPAPAPASDLTLAQLDAAEPVAPNAQPDDGVGLAQHRRHLRRSRAALALPYFSFAQGLRRISGS